jgi:uncharacterized protein involved in exopolysaccharide biosynthesis
MNVGEAMRLLWRQRLLFVGTLALVLLSAFIYLRVEPLKYRSTSTVALLPTDQSNGLALLGQFSAIVPIYAEAVTADPTVRLAADAMRPEQLANVSVRTFDTTPILKIDATSTSAQNAQRTADAFTLALMRRASSQDIGMAQVRVVSINPPTRATTPASPQPKRILAVALLLGVGGGIAIARVADRTKATVPGDASSGGRQRAHSPHDGQGDAALKHVSSDAL